MTRAQAFRANTHGGFPPTKIFPVSGGGLCKPLSAEYPCTDCSWTENTIRFSVRQELFSLAVRIYTMAVFTPWIANNTLHLVCLYLNRGQAVMQWQNLRFLASIFTFLAVSRYTVAEFTLARLYGNYRGAFAKPLL